LDQPDGSPRSGEDERGPSPQPSPNHIGVFDEPSSVGSSTPERRGLTFDKATPSGEEGSKTPENVRRLRDLWEQGTK